MDGSNPIDLCNDLMALLSSASQSLQQPPDQLALVVIPDTGRATVERFDDIHELVLRLRNLYNQPGIQVVPFRGEPLTLTRPPNRCLRFDGQEYPLQPEEPVHEEDNYFLCDQPQFAEEGLSTGNVDELEEDEDFEDDDLGDVEQPG